MTRLEIIHLRLAGPTPPGLVADISRAIGVGGAAARAQFRVCVSSRARSSTRLPKHTSPMDRP